jgi:hypothetical protein
LSFPPFFVHSKRFSQVGKGLKVLVRWMRDFVNSLSLDDTYLGIDLGDFELGLP